MIETINASPDSVRACVVTENTEVPKIVFNVYARNSAVGLSCVEVMVEGKDALYRCKAIIDSKSYATCYQTKLTICSIPKKEK